MGKKNPNASSDILWRLGTNLKRLREARGYSQVQLARRCGVTKSYISKIEQYILNISVANLEVLCDALDCAPEDLLRRPPKREIPPDSQS
jgi:transcriptional regulator with XRE-family HTH domain